MLIKLTKGENRRLQWVRKAASKEAGRGALNFTHAEFGHIVGIDGFRAHFAKVPEGLTEPVTFRLAEKLRVADTVADIEPVECDFPTAHNIVPTEKPEYEISVNGRYLREVLAGMDGAENDRVRLVFHRGFKPIEIYGKAADGTDVYALLMRIGMTHVTETLTWRPTPDGDK